jgi:hypothetical protein
VVEGIAAAAAHLDYSSAEAFKKARTRARGRGNPIPGETRRSDGVLRWPRLDLEEWHSKLPRSGARTADLDPAVGDE